MGKGHGAAACLVTLALTLACLGCSAKVRVRGRAGCCVPGYPNPNPSVPGLTLTLARAWVGRLLDLHLLLLRRAVAVVVVLSDCHRNVPPCAHLSLALSLCLARAVCTIACALTCSLCLSLASPHAALVQWLGITLVGVRVLRLLQLTVGLVLAAHVTVSLWISHAVADQVPTRRAGTDRQTDIW